MYTISQHRKRWRISRGRRVVLSGIGPIDQALAIAKAHGYVVTEITNNQFLRAA